MNNKIWLQLGILFITLQSIFGCGTTNIFKPTTEDDASRAIDEAREGMNKK